MYGVTQDGNVTTVLLTLSNPTPAPQQAASTTTNNNNSKLFWPTLVGFVVQVCLHARCCDMHMHAGADNPVIGIPADALL